MMPRHLSFRSVENFQDTPSYGHSETLKRHQFQEDKQAGQPGNLRPLSPAQKRIWYLCQFEDMGGSYNLIQEFNLTGVLEVSILEESVRTIMSRHKALRTTFKKIDEKLFREIHESLPVKISFHNLSQLTHQARNQKTTEASLDAASHIFDLENGPLFTIKILWFGKQEYHLIINMHHIISDGYSFEIFKKELSALYTSLINGKTNQLPSLSMPAEVEIADDNNLSEKVMYWQKKFREAPNLLELPTAKTRPAIQTFNGKRVTFSIDPKTLEGFSSICQKYNCSNYVGLLTTFKILLSRYTEREDVIVGSPFSGRHNDAEKKEHIDLYVRTIPLRTTISGELTFYEALKATKETVFEAFKNQEITFDKLVEGINPERNPSFSPLFQVMFAYQNYKKENFTMEGLKVTGTARQVTNSKFDLTLEITLEEGKLNGAFDFNTDVYEEAMVKQLANHYAVLIERLTKSNKTPVKELPLLTETEYQEMLFDWNQTSVSYPKDKCLHQLFEQQAQKTPEAIALSFGKQSMTYQELNTRANKLANLLINTGVEKEDFVGIQVNRSFEMVISVLAVLKSGAAYVAIDPEYPLRRKKFMLQDAYVKILLYTGKKGETLSKANIKTIPVDRDPDGLIARQSGNNPAQKTTVNNLAYMIYTSGSTGNPKGVLIEHKGLPNLIYDHIRKYELKQGNCVLQFASLSFDASICEIGMALLSGATLCIAPKDQILPGPELIKLLNNKKISHVTLPPSALSVLPKAALPHLKVITVTGEACPEILVDQWARDRKFFNGYGPSEVTIGATISEFKKGTKKTSIGKPFANYKVYLLDKHRVPVPVGVPGEIYIGGIGLARGYYKNDQATQEKFIDNPFSGNGEKIYKTGDIGRYLKGGDIEFIGRVDNLVKLRGMRIELGEIETAINEIEGISQSKVVLTNESPALQKIVAYYTINPPGISPDHLKMTLEEKLPKHLVPASFLRIDKFPKSPNGKIDVKALPEIEAVKEEGQKKLIAPRNAIEKCLREIWRDTLKMDNISIHDNFFDLGGHSLLAVYMITQIEKQLDVQIPVSALMKSPTIARLSTVINHSQSCPDSLNTMVAIKEGKETAPPLFLMHTPSGHVVSYYKLVAGLPPDYPVYGLQVEGLGSNRQPYYSLKEMARYYANEIKKIKPYGPFYLGGYCFGGLVAYEVARELRLQGEDIELLFLIGSRFPTGGMSEIVIGENETIPLIDKAFKSRIFYVWKSFTKHLWLKLFALYKSKNWMLPSRLTDYKLIHHEMIRKHVPEAYDGDVILIQPDGKSHRDHLRTLHSWEKLVTGKVHDCRVPGEQAGLLKAPSVNKLARLIGEFLKARVHK